MPVLLDVEQHGLRLDPAGLVEAEYSYDAQNRGMTPGTSGSHSSGNLTTLRLSYGRRALVMRE